MSKLLTQGARGHGVSEKSDEGTVEDLREGAIRKPRPLPRLLETFGRRRQLLQVLRTD